MKRKLQSLQLHGIRLFLGMFLLSAFILTGSITVSAAPKNFNTTPTVTISDTEAHFVSGEYTWIKYKAPKNGYITLTAEWNSKYKRSEGFWCLYASNRKTALTKNDITYSASYDGSSRLHTRQSVFGVKKGKTYYLRVQAYNGVNITCEFKHVKEKCANKRKKAPLLTRKKTVTGVILPKDKNKDWYKIKFKKAKYVQLFYNIKSDGKFKITFCNVLGGKMQSGEFGYTDAPRRIMVTQKNSVTKKSSKLNAGTYYIKVEPVDKQSSGYYTISWM